MKLPSLLRLPKNRQYSYRPRYYDPIKEELAAKERKFREQNEREGRKDLRESIAEAYKRRSRLDRKSDMRQIVFILAFVVITFGYIYIGSNILYILLILVPLYVWVRIRKR
jgi:Flp pilus assembly protein TadB